MGCYGYVNKTCGENGKIGGGYGYFGSVKRGRRECRRRVNASVEVREFPDHKAKALEKRPIG